MQLYNVRAGMRINTKVDIFVRPFHCCFEPQLLFMLVS